MSLFASYDDALDAVAKRPPEGVGEPREDDHGIVIPSAFALARGDSMLDDDAWTLESPIVNVDNVQWTQFVQVMATAPLTAVSPSNALGTFEMPVRRLADLGIVTKLVRGKSPAKKTIWAATFKWPMTSKKFLKSIDLQYDAFVKSMVDYVHRLEAGDIVKAPSMSLSGALAILHRAGPNGLSNWERGMRFEATEKLYNKVGGVF